MSEELVLTIMGECHPSLNKYERNVWAEQDKALDDWKWIIRLAIGKNYGKTGKFSSMLVEYYFNDPFPRDRVNFEPLYIKNGLELWGMVPPVVEVEWKIVNGAVEKKTVITLRR